MRYMKIDGKVSEQPFRVVYYQLLVGIGITGFDILIAIPTTTSISQKIKFNSLSSINGRKALFYATVWLRGKAGCSEWLAWTSSAVDVAIT